VSPAGIPAVRVVIATRPKTYPYRPAANRLVRPDKKGKRHVTFVDDPGGSGREAGRVVLTCPECAAKMGP
jgi:hypothetical protein